MVSRFRACRGRVRFPLCIIRVCRTVTETLKGTLKGTLTGYLKGARKAYLKGTFKGALLKGPSPEGKKHQLKRLSTALAKLLETLWLNGRFGV